MSARSPGGRALRCLGLLVGGVILAAVARSVGGGATLGALARVGPSLPLALALEAAIVATSGCSLGALYRAGGGRPPPRAFWWAVLVGHGLAVTLPAGRLVAEGWKAARLAPFTDGPRAAAGAVGYQAATLLANALGAIVAVIAVERRCGASAPTAAVGLFAGAMVALGAAVALAGRAAVGRRLGARFEAARAAGEAFDAAYGAAAEGLGRAVAWETLGRVLQCAQVGALRAALGAATGPVDVAATWGLVLAGAAAGDLLPAQLGATDAALALAAGRVGLGGGDALALTLALHAAQVGVGITGAGVALAVGAEARG
jgi:hypothetical protein